MVRVPCITDHGCGDTIDLERGLTNDKSYRMTLMLLYCDYEATTYISVSVPLSTFEPSSDVYSNSSRYSSN